MWRRGLVSLAAMAIASHASAEACTPILYDMSDVSAESFARQMINEARGVELMRVFSRTMVPADRTDPVILEYYAPVYLYRFESVETVSGRSHGTLTVAGLDEHWFERRTPYLSPNPHAPLWWTSGGGYNALQWTAIPDASNSGSIACSAPATFVVGRTYLVFRNAGGDLMGWRRFGRWRLRWPAIEPVSGVNDPWLREVRLAAARSPKPGVTFWEMVFELIFGNLHVNGSA